MGHTRKMTAAVVLTTAVVMLAAGCGGGGGGKGDDKPSAGGKASAAGSSGGASSSPSASATPTQVLAQIKGEQNMVVSISSAVRDKDGFVTVQGSVTNDGTSSFDAIAWRGQETALVRSGPSVAGAVLVDEGGKKRYYVLRDTDGRCLCTMGLIDIEPKESRTFFAQFPSPPETTTSVEFELPTMPPAKIPISEG